MVSIFISTLIDIRFYYAKPYFRNKIITNQVNLLKCRVFGSFKKQWTTVIISGVREFSRMNMNIDGINILNVISTTPKMTS